MHLIVGLGNPGDKYKNSRHNVGFILLDDIVSDWTSDKYSNSLISKNSESIFVKPQTFMNNSGSSVKHLSEKFPVPSENVVVIHDDIDLPFGSKKIVFESGAGGHNGVGSIIDNLGTNKFIRIKVGIAPTDADGRAIKPKPGIFQSQKSAVAKYVMKDFSKGDQDKLKALAKEIRSAIEIIVKDGRQVAMNRFN